MRGLVVVPLLLLLAACGSGDGDADQNESEAPETTLLEDARKTCGPAVLKAATRGGGEGLGDAAADPWIKLGDDGATLTIQSPTESAGDAAASLVAMGCALGATGAPDSVASQVQQTSALQGRQEAAWEGIDLSWSYHPDSGVSAVFTLADES
jgi:hypothetical protein